MASAEEFDAALARVRQELNQQLSQAEVLPDVIQWPDKVRKAQMAGHVAQYAVLDFYNPSL